MLNKVPVVSLYVNALSANATPPKSYDWFPLLNEIDVSLNTNISAPPSAAFTVIVPNPVVALPVSSHDVIQLT